MKEIKRCYIHTDVILKMFYHYCVLRLSAYQLINFKDVHRKYIFHNYLIRSRNIIICHIYMYKIMRLNHYEFCVLAKYCKHAGTVEKPKLRLHLRIIKIITTYMESRYKVTCIRDALPRPSCLIPDKSIQYVSKPN